MFKRSLTILTTAALAAIATAKADAAVPDFMTQQGRLLDGSGAPIDGELSFVFTIYDAASDGTALWTETTNVTLEDGFFSVQLGAASALDPSMFDGSTLYLGVKVGADAEMTPRQALLSTPYAFAANSADTALNATGDITPTTVAVNGSTVIDATGTWVGNVDFGGLTTVVEAISGESAEGGTSSVSASCGAGKVATGGGCSLTSTSGQSGRLKQSEPTVSTGLATGWACTCDAFPNASFVITDNSDNLQTFIATTCTVRARAICVPNP